MSVFQEMKAQKKAGGGKVGIAAADHSNLFKDAWVQKTFHKQW